MKFIKFIIGISCMVATNAVCAPSPSLYLDKVSHHPSVINPSIELGRIIFYFSRNPVVRKNNPIGSGVQQYTFFFPWAAVKNKDVRDMITRLNTKGRGQNMPYHVALQVIDTPLNTGIKLVISCDPKKVNIAYDVFEASDLKKGIIFRLYDKNLLRALEKQHKPIVRTASRGVVLDLGHGGRDLGTTGYNGLKEKEVTLGIGFKVAQQLKKKGVDVRLTRSRDQYLFLEDRTGFANNWKKNNIFVSIHANASVNKNVSGIETFCLDVAKLKPFYNNFKEAIQITKNLTYNLNKKSTILAENIQRTLVAYAQKKNPHACDRKVKKALFRVLAGTTMPAVLIEVGFISHPYEGKLLATKEYQQVLAKGISDGIISYLKSVAS